MACVEHRWLRLCQIILLLLPLAGVRVLRAEELARGSLRYKVMDELTLSEISILLYGTASRWKELAEVNHLDAPYLIARGRAIRLRQPARLKAEEGRAKLLEMWRRRFHLDPVPATGVARAQPAPAALPVVRMITRPAPAEQAALEKKLQQAIAGEKASQRNPAEAASAPLDDPLARAEAEAKSGAWREARADFEKARRKSPAEVSAWIGELQADEALHDAQAAHQLASDFTRSFPDLATLPLITRCLSEPNK